MFLPVLIIAIGIVWLLNNLGIISTSVWALIWPIVLILVGVSLVCGKKGCALCSCGLCKKHDDKR
jgi:hypothetical protein